MKTIIRKANADDASAFLAIKNQLPMSLADGTTTTGGFLLGTDLETYRFYINNAYCLVAEKDKEVVGFGIILPDALLRNSEVWIKRNSATWYVDLNYYEQQPLCYFEQFAFLPGNKKWAVLLAYNIVKWAFDEGNKTLFTTTVNKPILNLAAIPFIKTVSGIKAGNINEEYPLVGEINSDIYTIDAELFYQKVAEHPLYSFFNSRSTVLN